MMPRLKLNDIIEKAKKVKCVICDVDGVLTNGLLIFDEAGNELKGFHVHDGVGLKLLLSAGLLVSVITNSKTKIIDNRMKQLGINLFYKGQLEKETAYRQIKDKFGVCDEECAYIGDDFPDLPIITQVGLGVAVANATKLVKDAAIWQTERSGGQGAVRELCDLILQAQNKFDIAVKGYRNV